MALSDLFEVFKKYGMNPQIDFGSGTAGREMTLTLTKQDIENAIKATMNPKIAANTTIEVHEGVIVIKVRLM